MRIYLDDTRQEPEGWVRCFWPQEAIALLQTGEVKEISLDHDLGDDNIGTGYDVLLWMEEAVFNGFTPPEGIWIHSANPVGRKRMEQAIASIRQMGGKPNRKVRPASFTADENNAKL